MEFSRSGNLKNRAHPVVVVGGRSIEVAVAGKDQRRTRGRAIGILESVHGDELLGGCDLENVTVAIGSSIVSCAVEIALGIFNQPGVWTGAVGASRLCTEAMDRSELARWADLIDCAQIVGSPFGSCSV